VATHNCPFLVLLLLSGNRRMPVRVPEMPTTFECGYRVQLVSIPIPGRGPIGIGRSSRDFPLTF
jgi:hypothetical protein